MGLIGEYEAGEQDDYLDPDAGKEGNEGAWTMMLASHFGKIVVSGGKIPNESHCINYPPQNRLTSAVRPSLQQSSHTSRWDIVWWAVCKRMASRDRLDPLQRVSSNKPGDERSVRWQKGAVITFYPIASISTPGCGRVTADFVSVVLPTLQQWAGAALRRAEMQKAEVQRNSQWARDPRTLSFFDPSKCASTSKKAAAPLEKLRAKREDGSWWWCEERQRSRIVGRPKEKQLVCIPRDLYNSVWAIFQISTDILSS